MDARFRISFPYSLKEIFDPQARARANELRTIALEAWGDDKTAAWHYISRPRIGWGDERPLYEQSISSEADHHKAVDAIRQMQYGSVA